MKPLVLHEAAAAALFWTCTTAWLVGELAFAMRTTLQEGATRDASFFSLTLSMLGGLGLGVLAAATLDQLTLPGPGWWPVALGLATLAAGLWLRIRAIRELGRFFKYTVVVAGDHHVVETGPYRLIRHPSYSGLLLGMLGLGIALGNWLAIPACLVPPLVGFRWRLLNEERMLSRELGEPYRAYMRRTRRLIPGVW